MAVSKALRELFNQGERIERITCKESRMPISSSEGPPWGLLQWGVTGLLTALATGGGFIWNLMMRLEKLESNHARQHDEIEAMRDATDSAMLRFA